MIMMFLKNKPRGCEGGYGLDGESSATRLNSSSTVDSSIHLFQMFIFVRLRAIESPMLKFVLYCRTRSGGKYLGNSVYL